MKIPLVTRARRWAGLYLCFLSGLSAFSGTPPEPPRASSITILVPKTGARFTAPGPIAIEAEAVDPLGDIRRVDFYSGERLIGTSDSSHLKIAVVPGRPFPHHLEWKEAAVGTHRLIARGKDTAGKTVTSAPVTIEVGGVSAPEGHALVRAGTEWRWRYEEAGPADGWRTPTFDDSTWKVGKGKLGFGEDGEATVIWTGRAPLPVTAYFRRSFEMPADLQFSRLHLRLLRDDGAVVYLNGREIVRDNMPAGTVGHRTLAASTTEGEGFRTHSLSSTGLISGRNVIAVEVHQASTSSSDLGFDLDLTGVPVQAGQIPTVGITASRPTTAEPAPHIRVVPGQFTIHRTGSTTHALTVGVRYSGTARAGIDFTTPPALVVIPVGHAEATLDIMAIDDELVEESETVLATLAAAEVANPNPLALQLPRYLVDAAKGSATVTIMDSDEGTKPPAGATLRLASPANGSVFEPGRPIELKAIAIDPVGYLSRVTFHDGEKLIGVSEITFIRAPDPGTPIEHTYEWTGAAPGEHKVSARAVDTPGKPVVSPPVVLQVGGKPGNQSPRVAVVAPRNGAVMTLGQPIPVKAEASDADGSVARVDILADGRVIRSGTQATLEFEWKDVTPGTHKLVARAIDNQGAESVSTTVTIHVRAIAELAFVKRELPPAYLPGGAFEVVLLATPPKSALAWTVEDVPPTGWTATATGSDAGVDAGTGRVRFGPFTESVSRRLAYTVTPAAGASGLQKFTGTSSLDGQTLPVAGEDTVGTAGEKHPADATPADGTISADELTIYAGAWKSGRGWGAEGSIPLVYVTRAGQIWRQGGLYTFRPALGAPPECWAPGAGSGPVLASDSIRPSSTSTGGSAVRQLPGSWKPGTAGSVKLVVTPAAGAEAIGVEEFVPAGWRVAEIAEGGAFDADTGRIRWGLLFGDRARELGYSVVPPADAASNGAFTGRVSFDGRLAEILGSRVAGAADAGTGLRISGARRGVRGRVHLRVEAVPDQVFVVEASPDLVNWSDVDAFVHTGEELEVTDPGALPEGNRYYRLRPVGR